MGRIEEAVGRSAPFVKILPLPIISPRTPNVTDREFPKGQLWLDESVSPTIVWTHIGFGEWITSAGGGSGATTFPTDVGFAVDLAGVLKVLGGSGIDTAGGGNTVTVSVSSNIASSFPTDSLTGIPTAGALSILGAGGITTSAVGSVITITGSGTISVQTDTLVATPIANTLILQSGLPLSTDAVNGVTVVQGPAANEIHVQFTNTIYGTGTTVGLGSADIITFNLGGVPKVFRFDFNIAGRDIASGEGVGYKGFGTAKTDGANAFLVEETYFDMDEDNNLLNSEIDLIVVGNDVILRVDGGLIGATVNYVSRGTYVAV